jgi:stage IV sporulation protein FB
VFADNPTPFDLHFRLFGFPVRVSPWFWLVSALLGDFILRAFGLPYLLVWIACVFVSILLHELGHAFAARWFGSPARIDLIAFGGLATYTHPPRAGWRRMLIALAGPAAGFLFAGAVYGSNEAARWRESSDFAFQTYNFLIWINLFWNCINLLPVWPLDGGKVCRELAYMAGARKPDAIAYGVSMVVAGLLVVWGLLAATGNDPRWLDENVPFAPSLFMTLWFGLFAVQSYLLLQEANRQSAWGKPYADEDDDRLPWERR